jgi:hypothetical protein
MDEKLKSRAHLPNTFFDFLGRFLLQSFQINANMTFKNFWDKYKIGIKNADFTLISNPLRKYLKNAHKKVISKTSYCRQT